MTLKKTSTNKKGFWGTSKFELFLKSLKNALGIAFNKRFSMLLSTIKHGYKNEGGQCGDFLVFKCIYFKCIFICM